MIDIQAESISFVMFEDEVLDIIYIVMLHSVNVFQPRITLAEQPSDILKHVKVYHLTIDDATQFTSIL
jgi:hypothetical protein